MPGKSETPGTAAAPTAASTQNAATAADAGADGAGGVLLDDLIAPLRAIPDNDRPFGAAALVEFAGLMKRVQVGLLTRDREKEEIADQDRLLLAYLAAYFKGVCATPSIIHGDMLERAVAASGMVMPFAGPSEAGGAARFGEREMGRAGGEQGVLGFRRLGFLFLVTLRAKQNETRTQSVNANTTHTRTHALTCNTKTHRRPVQRHPRSPLRLRVGAGPHGGRRPDRPVRLFELQEGQGRAGVRRGDACVQHDR